MRAWQAVTDGAPSGQVGSQAGRSGRAEQEARMQAVSPSVAAQVASTNSIVVFASQLVPARRQ